MRTSLSILLLTSITGLWAGDARRGALVMDDQGCLACHTVRGQGLGHEALRPAPDLSGRLAAKYTPASLASVLWNHEPAMFAMLGARGADMPAASETDWEDLFTYLYSLQFADVPGEAARGARAFESKRCSSCHGPAATADRKATPVKEWDSVYDPVELLYQMWTHAATMYMQKERVGGVAWEKLSARDLMDLTAYAQSQQRLGPVSNFSLPAPAEGRAAFEARCSRCHQGKLALETLLKNATWMEIGAGLWNHAPNMPSGAATSQDEMRKLLAYVWDVQYSGQPGRGNSVAGDRTFRDKRCITCHKDAVTGAPRSPRPGAFTAYSMVSLSWGRGRRMHSQMQAQGVNWPELSAEEMQNLVAFLNTLR